MKDTNHSIFMIDWLNELAKNQLNRRQRVEQNRGKYSNSFSTWLENLEDLTIERKRMENKGILLKLNSDFESFSVFKVNNFEAPIRIANKSNLNRIESNGQLKRTKAYGNDESDYHIFEDLQIDVIAEQYSKEIEFNRDSQYQNASINQSIGIKVPNKGGSKKSNITPSFGVKYDYVSSNAYSSPIMNETENLDLRKCDNSNDPTQSICNVDISSIDSELNEIEDWKPQKDLTDNSDLNANKKKGMSILEKIANLNSTYESIEKHNDQEANESVTFNILLGLSQHQKSLAREEDTSKNNASSFFINQSLESFSKPQQINEIKSHPRQDFSDESNYSKSNTNASSKQPTHKLSIQPFFQKTHIDEYELTDKSSSSSDDETPIFDSANNYLLSSKRAKAIPKWAKDKEVIRNIIKDQLQTNKLDKVFSREKIENLDITMIFTNAKNGERGDSANWKMDLTLTAKDIKTKLFT